MNASVDGRVQQWRQSRTAGLLGIALLAVLLQFPISMMRALILERQERRDDAAQEIGGKWGSEQALTGPMLSIPYTFRWEEAGPDGHPIAKWATRTALVLPDQLKLGGQLATESRSRGIFEVPVYRAALDISGEFKLADVRDLGVADADIHWDRAELIVGIADVRALQQQPSLEWGATHSEFLPGTGAYAAPSPEPPSAPRDDGDPQGSGPMASGGIRAPVVVDPAAATIAFRFPLTLNGSTALWFVPFGRQTSVQLAGDTGEASFQGGWLPDERSLTASQFDASWSIPYLGRGYPQVFHVNEAPYASIDRSRFGVQLIPTLDAYRMAERSAKYAFLFIVLTFTAVWLMEVLTGLRVHAIQYLLVGAALCLFYLLELSLAEHIGFAAAYALASAAVVAMIGAYGLAMLKSLKRALLVASGVAGLYGYLYVLLSNEDYALLLGALGLFGVLGAVMYATRRVDWYGVEQSGVAATS